MSADNMLVDRYNEKYLAQKLERSLHQCHGGFVTCAGWKCLSSCQTKKKKKMGSDEIQRYEMHFFILILSG